MKRGGPLRRVSAKRARENRERRKAVTAVYGQNPPCAVPWCPNPADDGHEPGMRSRLGSIVDPGNVVPVCRTHHDWIHANPEPATEMGLLKPSWQVESAKKSGPTLREQRRAFATDRTGDQMDDTCTVEGCEHAGRARGYCTMHYQRWRAHGDPGPAAAHRQQGGPCSVDGCTARYEARGFCKNHYRLWSKYGVPHAPEREAVCAIEGCEGKRHAHGLCGMHHLRWRTHGDPYFDGDTLEERLWSRVQRGTADECWPWTGATLKGYGQIGDGGKVRYAHRVAYEVATGDPTTGLMVCHTCDNPPCCNPAHLFLGTAADNVQDMIRKQRGHWQRSA